MTFTGELTITSCWCGITYAIPTDLNTYVHRKHDNNEKQVSVYCPLGHTWIPAGESALDRERRTRERLERQLANRDEDLRAERASHTATKGQLTKTRKRASGGVCPHPECKRSFVDVARHVRSKHPELIGATNEESGV
jgi:hypothetical protein